MSDPVKRLRKLATDWVADAKKLVSGDPFKSNRARHVGAEALRGCAADLLDVLVAVEGREDQQAFEEIWEAYPWTEYYRSENTPCCPEEAAARYFWAAAKKGKGSP